MTLKTVSEGFDAFLLSQNPVLTENNKVSSHENSVKGCLQRNFGCTALTATGSFGLGTSIRHHSDSDYFAILPSANCLANSAIFLRRIKEALQVTFPTTLGIVVNSPAVAIPFGKYASETMEIVPAYFTGLHPTPLGQFRRFGIPDSNSAWMYASPDAHNKYVNSHNERLNYRLKNLIRLVKAWKYYNGVEIHSFYLEILITKQMENRQRITYKEDLYKILKYLNDIQLNQINDPMGISGIITACKTEPKRQTALSKLNTAVTRAEKALEEEKKGNIDMAFYYWNSLFSNLFPNR